MAAGDGPSRPLRISLLSLLLAATASPCAGGATGRAQRSATPATNALASHSPPTSKSRPAPAPAGGRQHGDQDHRLRHQRPDLCGHRDADDLPPGPPVQVRGEPPPRPAAAAPAPASLPAPPAAAAIGRCSCLGARRLQDKLQAGHRRPRPGLQRAGCERESRPPRTRAPPAKAEAKCPLMAHTLPPPCRPQCTRLIYAYMGFAGFSIFFVLTGIIGERGDRAERVRAACAARVALGAAALPRSKQPFPAPPPGSAPWAAEGASDAQGRASCCRRRRLLVPPSKLRCAAPAAALALVGAR